ncbi:hypothetical protein MMC25_005835 [Agyrium rufum]|nr:hypothetical protein [Agyrium rufum]
MAFMLEEEGAMFTGDNVLGHGTAVFEDLPAYLASLALMKGKFRVGETGRVYPGHGEYIDDGKAKIEEYITHREMREREILKALEGGKAKVDDVGSGDGTTKDGMTAMEVVKVVYRDVPEALHAPAEGGVKKILKKLEGEGKVRNCGRGGEWVVVKGGGKATL